MYRYTEVSASVATPVSLRVDRRCFFYMVVSCSAGRDGSGN